MKLLERALSQMDGLMDQARRENELIALGCLIEASNIIWNQLKHAYAQCDPRQDVGARNVGIGEDAGRAVAKN